MVIHPSLSQIHVMPGKSHEFWKGPLDAGDDELDAERQCYEAGTILARTSMPVWPKTFIISVE